MPPVLAKPRKDFTADALFRLTRSYFGRMYDPRQGKISILLCDALITIYGIVRWTPTIGQFFAVS